MKCYRCQADNPDHATHCGSCGARLEEGLPPSPLGVACGVALLVVFVPIGLCGALVAVREPYGPPSFAYLCMAVSALFILVAYLIMRRR